MIRQYLVQLENVEPLVWRRILIPDDSSMWELHCAITDALGWLDCHLHKFRLIDPPELHPGCVGIPSEWDDREILPGWEIKTEQFFYAPEVSAQYMYDFGDGWTHRVTFEKELPEEDGASYPRCIDGAHACPPENVGGPWGYQDFLKAISDKNDPEHETMLAWCGGQFDPTWFDMELVQFDDAAVRWQVAFENMERPPAFRNQQHHVLR